MHFRIGTILPAIISALALMGVAATGYTAIHAYHDREEAATFVGLNGISQSLLRGAGHWAKERGMTNAALNSPELLPADRRSEIDGVRAISDQAFRDAVQRLRDVPAMKGAEQRVSEAERALQNFESLRRKVDANLAKPGPERDPEVVKAFAPAITDLIEVAANKLRLTLETLTSPASAAMARLVGLRHLTAEMAEKRRTRTCDARRADQLACEACSGRHRPDRDLPRPRRGSPGRRSPRLPTAPTFRRRSRAPSSR